MQDAQRFGADARLSTDLWTNWDFSSLKSETSYSGHSDVMMEVSRDGFWSVGELHRVIGHS